VIFYFNVSLYLLQFFFAICPTFILHDWNVSTGLVLWWYGLLVLWSGVFLLCISMVVVLWLMLGGYGLLVLCFGVYVWRLTMVPWSCDDLACFGRQWHRK
jgi:hypothetical protein